jgi:hypothetical protein
MEKGIPYKWQPKEIRANYTYIRQNREREMKKSSLKKIMTGNRQNRF